MFLFFSRKDGILLLGLWQVYALMRYAPLKLGCNLLLKTLVQFFSSLFCDKSLVWLFILFLKYGPFPASVDFFFFLVDC